MGFDHEANSPRWWDFETRFLPNYLHEHLRGDFRGLVHSVGEWLVPCIVPDLDRHSGVISAKDHIRNCLKAHVLLTKKYNNYLWLPEVNPKNGSTKFFGFNRDMTPIPIKVAQDIGAEIDKVFLVIGVGKREIFPLKSMRAVLLPLRLDKLSLTDKGIMPKCIKKKKTCRVEHTYYPEFGYSMPDYIPCTEEYETYSSLGFIKWLQRGEQCSTEYLHEVLKECCANCPDVIIEDVVQPATTALPIVGRLTTPNNISVGKRPTDMINLKTLTGEKIIHTSITDELRYEPNSLTRQLYASLIFCRRQTRVVNLDEALQFIRTEKLYTGDWSDRESKRRGRVQVILNFIAQTFEEEKCCHKNNKLHVIHRECFAPAKQRYQKQDAHDHEKFTVNEHVEIVRKRKTIYKATYNWREMGHIKSICKEAMQNNPNPKDGSCSRDKGIKPRWIDANEKGFLPPWSDEGWVVSWESLVRDGYLESDGIWSYPDGKAKVWKVNSDIKPKQHTVEVKPSDNVIGLGLSYTEFVFSIQTKPPVLNIYIIDQKEISNSEHEKQKERPPP